MLTFLLTLVGDDPKEQERFRKLYDKYCTHMYIRALSYMKNEEDALDVLQEAFIRIARNFGKIDDLDSDATKHFLLTIVDNQARTEHARNARRRDAEEASLEEWRKVQEEVRGLDDYTEIELAELIKSLPDAYRRPLYMYYVDGMTAKEIAGILNTSHTAVRKRIERARMMLREMIEAQP